MIHDFIVILCYLVAISCYIWLIWKYGLLGTFDKFKELIKKFVDILLRGAP